MSKIESAPAVKKFKFKKKVKIAVVMSRFNSEVTEGLLAGVEEVLAENKVSFSRPKDLFYSPGAFETPLIAQKLAKGKKYQGVVCLGCVIKGDTAHFEFISLGATIGIQQVALATGKPISFGILTTYKEEQAVVRSRPGHANKGREAALACLETLHEMARI